jgi:uncharacterized phage infection (PIP) family protein YhgE
MGAGELSLFESGIWIIPLALIASLAGMYALIRSWQGKTRRDLKSVQADLRTFQTDFRQLEIDTQRYTTEDREPFGSEMKALAGRLESIAQRLAYLQQHYGRVRAETHRLGLHPWQLLVGAPFFLFQWLGIRRMVGDLRRETIRMRAEFSALQGSTQVLARRGWDVASRARQVLEKERQARQALNALGERHVQGDAFEAALLQAGELRAILEQVPDIFFKADETTLLAQSDKEVIADVFELLHQAEPAADRLLEQVREWERQYEEASGRVADLRRTLGEIRDLMATLPPELVLTQHQDRLKQLSTISENLSATLARLEIESVPQVVKEAERVQVAAREMGEELKRSRRQIGALGRILEELSAGLKELSGQFADLAKNPVHPILWNQSRPRLTELSRQVAALGAPDQGRLPGQVDKDLAAASALLAEQKDLARHCQRIAAGHTELLNLLASPELQGAPDWLVSAEALAAQVGAYAPDNWPRSDVVASFMTDTHTLSERQTRLISDSRGDPLPEAEVNQQLEAVKALVEGHRSLRARAGRIKDRLAEIQDLEKSLRERFGTARTMLNQVELLARSNDFLNEIAMAEIGGLRSQLEARGTELGQRRQGLVEEKVRLLNALITQIEGSTNGWLERLNGDIENKKKLLAMKVDGLDEIAALDERGMVEAQSLLSQDLANSVAQRSRQKPSFPLEELVTQIKPRCDTWQACVAALRAVEDLEKPLVETYQEALHQYELVREQLARATSWLSGKRSWPPTSVSLDPELQEFKNLEAQWKEMVSQPNRAIVIVRQLGDLSARFQKLQERSAQKVERAESEQTRIHDLEVELEDLSRRWQALIPQYPEGANDIRSLTSQITRETESLKRQARQGTPYAEVLQSLSFICENVQNEQITLEDGRVIRLSGDGSRNFRRRF